MSRKTNNRGMALALLVCVAVPAIPAVRQWLLYHPWLTAAFWLAVGMVMVYGIRQMHVPGRLSGRGTVAGYAASGAVIYLALTFLAGVVLEKLAASPYDRSPSGLVYNLATVFPVLVVRELIRAYETGTVWRTTKYRKFWLVMVTLILAVTEVNVSKWGKVQGAEEIFIYVVRDIVPVFTRNVLTAVLVFYGGAAAGITYGGVIQGFQRFFPFLPDLPWIADSAIGIAFPVLYTMFVQEHCRRLHGERVEPEEKHSIGYLIMLGVCVACSWFTVGVFSVYPSVILTGSMEPGIMPGDVVLIRKLKDEDEIYKLKEGDVINFRREDITITHRIYEVLYDEAGNVTFRTKGDNNKSVDGEIVNPNDITGTIEQVVPKAGIPVLIMKSGMEVPEGVIDDGEEDGAQDGEE